MHHHLSTNKALREAVSRVHFHWCGERSDVGILMLKECPSLERLAVCISVATTFYLTPLENDIMQWFRYRKHRLVTEGLGFHELIKLRGLKEVIVQHAAKRISERRTDHEASALRSLLNDRLLKNDEDDENNA